MRTESALADAMAVTPGQVGGLSCPVINQTHSQILCTIPDCASAGVRALWPSIEPPLTRPSSRRRSHGREQGRASVGERTDKHRGDFLLQPADHQRHQPGRGSHCRCAPLARTVWRAGATLTRTRRRRAAERHRRLLRHGRRQRLHHRCGAARTRRRRWLVDDRRACAHTQAPSIAPSTRLRPPGSRARCRPERARSWPCSSPSTGSAGAWSRPRAPPRTHANRLPRAQHVRADVQLRRPDHHHRVACQRTHQRTCLPPTPPRPLVSLCSAAHRGRVPGWCDDHDQRNQLRPGKVREARCGVLARTRSRRVRLAPPLSGFASIGGVTCVSSAYSHTRIACTLPAGESPVLAIRADACGCRRGHQQGGACHRGHPDQRRGHLQLRRARCLGVRSSAPRLVRQRSLTRPARSILPSNGPSVGGYLVAVAGSNFGARHARRPSPRPDPLAHERLVSVQRAGHHRRPDLRLPARSLPQRLAAAVHHAGRPGRRRPGGRVRGQPGQHQPGHVQLRRSHHRIRDVRVAARARVRVCMRARSSALMAPRAGPPTDRRPEGSPSRCRARGKPSRVPCVLLAHHARTHAQLWRLRHRLGGRDALLARVLRAQVPAARCAPRRA